MTKFTTHLWLKILQKVDIEETYHNILKAICDKTTANIILNSEKSRAFPLRTGTRQEFLLLPLWVNIVFKVLTIAISEEKKRAQIGKIKLSLFTDDMILHIENPKCAIRKLLELINGFSKAAEYKINTQKSAAFLTLTIKDLKEKLRKQSHLPSHQRK